MAVCIEKFSVLHIDTEKRFGGGQKQALILARGLRNEGIESVFALKKSAVLREKIGSEFECVTFSFKGEWDLQSALKILSFVKKRNFSIVHSHTAHGAFYSAFLKLWGIKTVHTRRVSYHIKGFLKKTKYRLHDAIVCVCSSIKDNFSFIDDRKLYVIHSAVDIRGNDISRSVARKRLGLPVDGKVILNVGNILPMKGQKILLDAFALLNRRICLLIAGDGDKSILQRMINDKGLSNVYLLGFVDDVEKLYPATDVVVISSTEGEGSPAVLKEAFWFGIPVVATDVGGIREIGEGACLIVPPDDASAIFHAVERIFKDEKLRDMLIEAGKKRVYLFSPQNMVKRYIDVYEKVLWA
ncbi:MAG: glycosyltransferase [Deltaproteobacteria bacterium]|nr:glycosyltransferase [Deltaproteobacteria bacterium]